MTTGRPPREEPARAAVAAEPTVSPSSTVPVATPAASARPSVTVPVAPPSVTVPVAKARARPSSADALSPAATREEAEDLAAAVELTTDSVQRQQAVATVLTPASPARSVSAAPRVHPSALSAGAPPGAGPGRPVPTARDRSWPTSRSGLDRLRIGGHTCTREALERWGSAGTSSALLLQGTTKGWRPTTIQSEQPPVVSLVTEVFRESGPTQRVDLADPPPRRRRASPVLSAIAAGILAVSGVAAFWSVRHDDAGPSSPETTQTFVRDDFSTSELSAAWSPYTATSANGGLTRPEQIQVRAGELEIIGQGNDPTGRGNRSGGLCWCGTGEHRLYGTWRVRARFDAGSGYGPTIGLWPTSNDARADGSVMVVSSALADRSSSWHSVTGPGGVTEGRGSSQDATSWHVYQVDWRKDYVRIQVDGQTVLDTRRTGTRSVALRSTHDLYLQQDIGPKDGLQAADTSTPATVTMHVDWVSYHR